jgi:hypothetical protein
MGVEHLQGKRTGRRPGSKSAPPWVRDVRWAYRNLGKPDAVPPSDGARFWLTVAREQPDKFFACLVLLGTPEDKADCRKSGGPPEPDPDVVSADGRRDDGNGATLALRIDPRPLRVKTLFVPEAHLRMHLTGDRPLPWVMNLPRDFVVLASAVDRGRKGLVLTLYSGAFDVVAEGEPIPELAPKYTCGR